MKTKVSNHTLAIDKADLQVGKLYLADYGNGALVIGLVTVRSSYAVEKEGLDLEAENIRFFVPLEVTMSGDRPAIMWNLEGGCSGVVFTEFKGELTLSNE